MDFLSIMLLLIYVVIPLGIGAGIAWCYYALIYIPNKKSAKVMQEDTDLLTQEEYNALLEKFQGNWDVTGSSFDKVQVKGMECFFSGKGGAGQGSTSVTKFFAFCKSKANKDRLYIFQDGTSSFQRTTLENTAPTSIELMAGGGDAFTTVQRTFWNRPAGYVPPSFAKLEWACNWTNTKTQTTMDAIQKSDCTGDETLVYHFTSIQFADLILKGGLRMSSVGQGDGGVYFAKFGPHEYGFGTPAFKKSVVIDCFGEERLQEYANAPNFQVVLVCSVKTMLLKPVPGGRDNAVMVPRTLITTMQKPAQDGFYYLDPHVIKRAYQLEDPTGGLFHAVEDVPAIIPGETSIRIEPSQAATAVAPTSEPQKAVFNTENWRGWTPQQVCEWVKSIPSINQYHNTFLSKEITGEDLPDVDDAFLSDIGLESKLAQKKVLHAISELTS